MEGIPGDLHTQVLFIASFHSVVLAFTAVLTIAFTVIFVYGSAVFVYQAGLLNGLGLQPFNSTGGLVWMVPVMSFTVVVGLAARSPHSMAWPKKHKDGHTV